jgi:hypothetical protein
MPTDAKSQPHVNLRIILLKPTAEVDFGLQKGKGTPYQTIQKQRSNGQDLSFEFEAGIKKNAAGDPDFNGAFVQGPQGGRFVYINIGASAGQISSQWNRLKVSLRGFARKQLEDTAANSKSSLKRGFPEAVATVAQTALPSAFDGWKLSVHNHRSSAMALSLL